MDRSFDLVDEKLRESDFFLRKLEESGRYFGEARFYFSAFLSATRTVTYALQAVMHHIGGFDDWYRQQQTTIKNNSLAKYFHSTRNEGIHIGFNPVGSGTSYQDDEGDWKHEYYFFYGFDEKPENTPETDVITACKEYFKLLIEVIYQCYRDFGSIIDPQQYYTLENIAKIGLSIEDIEDSLGLPRGHTSLFRDEVRIALIADSMPGPHIDDIFVRYLGRNRFGEEVNDNV